MGPYQMERNEIQKSIRFILNGFEEIDLAYVFGSFLERDDFHDIDIAIHLGKEQSPYQRFKLSQKVARSLEQGIEPRVDFDVRILNYAPVYFQYEVISKGIVVLETRSRREELTMRLISSLNTWI